MNPISGSDADREIQRALRTRTDGLEFAERPFERLYRAIAQVHSQASGRWRPSPLDLAVLVRHVLRYRSAVRGEHAEFVASRGVDWPDVAVWQRVGVDSDDVAGGYRVRARGWRPTWLSADHDVDFAAAGEFPRRSPGIAVARDPYLKRLHWDTFKSRAQRAAIRSALTTPQGSTLLVILPTAEGKSAVFELMARRPDGGEVTDTILVVTPTVALALDLERRSREAGFVAYPRAYRGGSLANNREIATRLREGNQGLCFASPEAACGPLRSALVASAASGRFRALVVDEAHLIDAWSDDFRPEFQLLPALRAELKRASPLRSFQTFLLSATVTQRTLRLLREAFANIDRSNDFGVGGGVKLRPEIEYWFSSITERDERLDRALEAICHLPRPIVVYTTKIADAERLVDAGRQLGLSRIADFTSDTPRRDVILDEWHRGQIDVIVATSAFGLGVDTTDIRAIVHACLPESLDRYYQETGRAGRDGRAAIAMCLPAYGDASVAEAVSESRSDIGWDTAYGRWRALFQAKRPAGDGASYLIDVDVPPGVDERYIDMQNPLSQFWHKRVLNQLVQCGFLELRGLEQKEQQGSGPPVLTIRVEIRDPQHLSRDHFQAAWTKLKASRIEGRRLDRGAVEDVVSGVRCVGEALRLAYELEPMVDVQGLTDRVIPAWSCGGCPSCRSLGRPVGTEDGGIVRPPWPATLLRDPCARLSQPQDRLLVFYEVESRSNPLMQKAIDCALSCGVSNLLLLDWPYELRTERDTLFVASRSARLVEMSSDVRELPRGPLLILVGRDGGLFRSDLYRAPNELAPFGPRIYFLPETIRDPDAPEQLLRHRFAGSQRSLVDFVQEHQF